MSYPASNDTFDTPTNLPGQSFDSTKQSTIYSEHFAQRSTAILNVENTLGINPQGSSSTVVARLNAVDTAIAGKQASLGFTPEDVANKSTTSTLGTSDTLYPSQHAVKTYVDTGLATKQASLGFTAENVANKSTTTTLGTSNTLYPSQNAVKTYVDTSVSGLTLSGDVTGSHSSNTVVKVNGASVPTSKAIVGTNGSGQLIDATATTLSNSTTGNAATATKLATGRTILTNLASTSSATFDGSANVTPGISGTLPVSNGGTGATTLTSGNVLLGSGTSAITSAKAAPSGDFVGTTDSQSLTNKQITGATASAVASGLTGGIVSSQLDIHNAGYAVTGTTWSPVSAAWTIPANDYSGNPTGYRLTVLGNGVQASTPAQLNFMLSVNGNTTHVEAECAVASTLIPASSSFGWNIVFYIFVTSSGSSGTIAAYTNGTIQQFGNTPAQALAGQNQSNGTIVWDTTSSNTLTCVAEWVTHTGTVTGYNSILERLGN